MAKKEENPVEAEVAARNAVKEQQVAEYYAREAASRPTPTQAENDLAIAGVVVEEKEDDGSEWEEEGQRAAAEGRLLGGAYATRDMEAGDSGEGESGTKKRGRPRKSDTPAWGE